MARAIFWLLKWSTDSPVNGFMYLFPVDIELIEGLIQRTPALSVTDWSHKRPLS
ncbi:unnamed protein product [Dovyalis caffra]|uniref:Uncharacterized protein n=1 Tax=Dovyalis caffra TaxID=77055 RepID=A0AAV1RC73_9ROSI|nr:unnamed protein product [Dovyalis caffra]